MRLATVYHVQKSYWRIIFPRKSSFWKSGNEKRLFGLGNVSGPWIRSYRNTRHSRARTTLFDRCLVLSDPIGNISVSLRGLKHHFEWDVESLLSQSRHTRKRCWKCTQNKVRRNPKAHITNNIHFADIKFHHTSYETLAYFTLRVNFFKKCPSLKTERQLRILQKEISESG